MRLRLGQNSSSTTTRLAFASLVSVMLAGCSSDVTRFASDPFSMDPAPTASIRQSASLPSQGFEPASVGFVASQPLAPVNSAPLAAPASNYGSARQAAPAMAQPAPARLAPPANAPKVIPAPAQAQVATPAQPPARANEKLTFTQGAQHAGAAPAKAVEAPKAVATPAQAPVKQVAEIPAKQAEKPVVEKPKQVAKLETGAAAATSVVPASAPAAAPQAAAEPESDKPEFRWPARGRIIQGFKAGANEGINIALPEGTSVKAAEAGVVAYAGNELKGYGNLVLIRHPNGFVSAYANNGEISVKRGETVKRGQAIAKSGQTGNVSSPQLHFELRKGSTPVDPTEFLAGL